MTQQEPQVDGITRADFQSWKHHPVTKLVWRFLADKREFMKDIALNQWVEGSLSLQTDQTLRGQVIELLELENIDFYNLVDFYRKEEEQFEAEVDQDKSG